MTKTKTKTNTKTKTDEASQKQNGVEIVSRPESHENGKFAHILDPVGNKLELWEPMVMDEKNKK